ncbi:MAG: hypothetical protein J6B72_03005, partial [Clostridia bacterium]|nr:hypothetical protein [Clostridia bacterium]
MCIGVSAGGSAANEPAERPSDYVFTRIEIPGGAKEITLGDDTYNVIRTLGELQSITADGKYVLANDIDFGGKVIFGKLFSESWNGVFDGNGFTFKNFLVVGMADGCGLFLADSGADITVKNLNIGSASELIGFGASNNKMSGLICGKVGANAKLTVENVNIYATVSGGWQTGGFVGRGDAGCTIALNNCTMNGSVSSTVGKTGGFIGDNDGSSTFINCVNNADVSASYQNNGGFIGLSNKSTATITINGCVQNGNVTSTNATYGAGGFIGKAWSKVLISNSRFEGALSVTAEDSTSLSGEYMGHSCSNLSLALPLGVTNISRDLVGQYAAYTLIPQNTIAVKTAEDLKAMKGNGWYRLESDLTLTEAVEIIGGDISGVTLDLNGKTLTGELVVKDGTVVIGNGTLRSSDIGYAVTAKGESTLIL